jgi:outer membrane cobalamin receptor
MKHRALPRLSLLAQALLLLGGAAQAQTQPAAAPQQLERIEITGSSIKRIDAETALPVQVLKREDIAKTGASTAAELMKAHQRQHRRPDRRPVDQRQHRRPDAA